MSKEDDSPEADLVRRLDRVAEALHGIDEPGARGAVLLTLLEAAGVRVKVKKRDKKKKRDR